VSFLLHCMSPLMAQSGHFSIEFRCPLLGVKRTSAGDIFQANGLRRYNGAKSSCEKWGGSGWTKLSFSLTEKPMSG
jgi:hypothetical protein